MALAMNVRKRLAHFELRAELRCEPGSLTALVGPSGAGKTTLMRIAAGLDQPDEGRVALGACVWVDTAAGVFVPPRHRGLGFVFQDYPLFPHLTVRANVAIAARRRERVDELLELFGIARLAGKRPGAISGGERQRAAFCQALARDPVLLLLDEPFSALDAATRRALRRELAALKGELGVPIVHVTHDLEEARELGDAIVAVEEGRISPDWLERNSPGRCPGEPPAPGGPGAPAGKAPAPH
ncbi:ATP-binding cassette domain-containing protein [Desulfocurvus sp.]|jgi:molybdate transport system ATP-binding protein|uniref:ATP-binding cassette domain-containing protein n=1 Tax=Desulfocurvus sp. TaxID=2871698 RepID=UPI0025BA55B1|nr:ATP-binding cassette domain-containing protein [Desulfocurvus sp.]MCK9240503.1 ATP-binding cassette domain-containing protein [Desulfocurvus sp.]